MPIALNESSSAGSGIEAAWATLDQFGLALRRCTSPEAEVRLTLETLAEALDADAVFWHAGTTHDAPLAHGSPEPSLEWRRQFLERVVADGAPGGLLLRQFLDPAAKPAVPWPLSAVLARLSDTGGSWLAALRFAPRRLFAFHDLHIVALVRRLLLNHRQRTGARAPGPADLDTLVRRLAAAIDELLCQGGTLANEALRDRILACRQELERICR